MMKLIADPLVRRCDVELLGDPRRVVAQLFVPGQETLVEGDSRASAVIDRVLAMENDEFIAALTRVREGFDTRYDDLEGILSRHFNVVSHRFPNDVSLSPDQQLLIGAYFTREYSLESAALFNPSRVAHPDQSGLATGSVRFVVSLRAVGEGHISSIGFREGTVDAAGSVSMVDAGQTTWLGYEAPYRLSSHDVLRQLDDSGGATESELFALSLLGDEFDALELEAALGTLDGHRMVHEHVDEAITRLRWIGRCNYAVEFPDRSAIHERVLWPHSPTESHGMEDARFVRFANDDGSVSYRGTYTAFDGSHVVPQLIQTSDFRTFEIKQLSGAAAKNKGLALFPRKISGRYLALSRWDRESNDIAWSDDGVHWDDTTTIQQPENAWELVQLGNCGSPIETDEGWLVLTHGVGPMRTYSIGALLLDLDDPSHVIGRLRKPLLTPSEQEREGYVPNVVYSCGAMTHGGLLVLPYGCSDSKVRFATVELQDLLAELRV